MYAKQQDGDETLEHVWKIIGDNRVCMLTSWNGKQQQSRPMTPHADRERHTIYFLDMADSEKEKEIKEFPETSLIFVDQGGNNYLSVAGNATVQDDRILIKRLWSNVYKAWWKDETDPRIRVIVFTPQSAELWDGPHKLVAGAIMLINATTGAQLPLGANAKVEM